MYQRLQGKNFWENYCINKTYVLVYNKTKLVKTYKIERLFYNTKKSVSNENNLSKRFNYQKEETTLKNSIKTLAAWLVIGIILLFIIPAILNGTNNELTYSELLSKIEAGEVTDIEIAYGGESARVKLKNDSNIKNVNITSVYNLMENLNT